MVSLRERLRYRGAEALAQVAHHWGVSLPEAAGAPDVDALIETMVADTPVRTAFDRLKQPEKEVLRAMASAAHKGWVATTDIRRLTGIPDSQVPDLLQALEAKAIAFSEERDLPVDNPYWGPTWAGRRLATRPTPVVSLPEETTPLLLEVIGEYVGSAWFGEVPSPINRLEVLPSEVLHAMAGHYCLPEGTPGETSSRLASRLQSALKDPMSVWRVICALPPELREVLDALEAAGGRLLMDEVRQRFAAEYEDLHILLRALLERGLAFDRFVHRSRVLLVPDRILEALAQHTLPEIPRAHLEPVTAPAVIMAWDRDLHWSLLQLVRHIRLEGLPRTATTRVVPKRIAARLVAQMREPPGDAPVQEWIEQLVLYLESVGVVSHGAHVRLNDPQAPWVHQDVFTQAQALLTRWLAGNVEDLRQSSSNLGLWMDRPLLAAGRSLLLDVLRQCKPGQWYTIDSLIRTARSTRPYFLQERDRIVRQQGYRGLKRMLNAWYDVEGRALLLHLTGLPFELGMVGLDGTLKEGTHPRDAAFQLSPWGAALLGMVPPPTTADPRRVLVVQPNFEVVAMEFVPEVLDALGEFAMPVAYDRVATYRLERRGVNLAVAGGWTGERMLALLEEHSRTPIPQNVAQSLREWASSMRRARFVQALVVEADDPTVLEDLAGSRVLQGQVRGIPHGAVLLLSPDTDLKQAARDLRAEGFLLEPAEE